MQSIYVIIFQNISYIHGTLESSLSVWSFWGFFLRENLHWAQCILIAQE